MDFLQLKGHIGFPSENELMLSIKEKHLHNFMQVAFSKFTLKDLGDIIQKCTHKLHEIEGESEILPKSPHKDEGSRIVFENLSYLGLCCNTLMDQLKILREKVASFRESGQKRITEENKVEEESKSIDAKIPVLGNLVLIEQFNVNATFLVIQCISKALEKILKKICILQEGYKFSSAFALSILANRISLALHILPTAMAAPTNDLFYLELENSEEWKSIELHLEIISELNEKLEKSYDNYLNKQYNMLGGYIKGMGNNKKGMKMLAFTKSMGNMMLYSIFKDKGKVQAESYLKNPDIQSLKTIMNAPEGNKYLGPIRTLSATSVKTNIIFFVPKLLTPLTIQNLTEQIEENIPLGIEPHYFIEKKLFDPDKHVKLRLLYSGEFKKQKQSGKIYAEGLPESLIIHIHGGGFISGSSKNSEIYTRKWTKELKVPIISIDYGLTPEHKYPDQLNDIWNAYYWLITQGPTQLGLKINTVILGGDSQGASLCMGLTLLCIRRKFISPHGLILGYPQLLGSVERFVPSLLMGLEDINQRYTSMEILNQAYGSSFGKPLDDPFLSPLLIPHKDLEKFPPIRILCCGRDPSRDYSYILLHALVKANNNVIMKELRMFPHGVWSLDSPALGFKQCSISTQIAIDWINQLILIAKNN